MKNEHLSVGIGGGWINENEVNLHLCFLEMGMITFEEIMRDGGVFYLLKYDGSEIKTFPYSMIWCKKDSEFINIKGESFDYRHTWLMVADRKDEDKSYVFDGIFMFVADDRCLDDARMVFIDKLVEQKSGEIGEMKEKIKSFKKEMRILKRMKK